MILTFMSWCWIGVTAFLTGFAVLEWIGKVASLKGKNSSELYILMGLCVLTVYSQIFSLFKGVGCGATALLGMICFVILICYAKKLKRYFLDSLRDGRWYKLILSLLIVGGGTLYYSGKNLAL